MKKNAARHIFITRTEEPLLSASDDSPLLKYLEKKHIATTIVPLLTILPIPQSAKQDFSAEAGKIQAILFTSSHAVKLWAQQDPSRDILVLTVGDQTAATAHELGFTQVKSAVGDANDLVDLVKATLKAENGKIIYPCARITSVNMAEKLQPLGFSIETVILYDSLPLKELPADIRQKIRTRQITDIIFFSVRGATTFKDLVNSDHSLKIACKRIHCLCFSQAIAHQMKEFPWQSVHISAKPDIPSLIELIEATDSSQRDNPMFYAEKDYLTRILSFISLILVLALTGTLLFFPHWFWQESSSGALPNHLFEQLQETEKQLTATLQTQQERLNKLEALIQNSDTQSLTTRLQNVEQQLMILSEKLSAFNPSNTAAVDLNPLLSSLQDLSKRFTSFETINQTLGQNIQSLTQDTTQLRNQLNNGNSRLQSLENAWNTMIADRQQWQTQVTALEKQVTALQEKAKIDQDPALAALFLTASQFETALMNGQPFVNELAAIKRLGAQQPTIQEWLKKAEALESWSISGLASYPQLQQQFTELAKKAAQDDLAQGLRQDGWNQQFATQFSGLITIRPIGAQTTGDDLLSKLARAEAKLMDKQFAAAAAELKDDNLPSYLKEWRNHLNARLQADMLLVEFKNIILKKFVSNP